MFTGKFPFLPPPHASREQRTAQAQHFLGARSERPERHPEAMPPPRRTHAHDTRRPPPAAAVVQFFFGVGVGGEYPVASTSANERAEHTKHLQNRRGETVGEPAGGRAGRQAGTYQICQRAERPGVAAHPAHAGPSSARH